jgi:NADPH:quinone reductase-like Zn-dependent oxidoreductase
MKAARLSEYGSADDVVRIMDVEVPTPKDDEVLIRVVAASVNALDAHRMKGPPRAMRLLLGMRKPKDNRIGVDVAGQIESVGAKVTKFRAGDEVFGVCRGAYAEYACAQESRIVLKPVGVSFEEAAATPVAGVTALQGLRDKGKIQQGEKVLINGAGGGVGTFAVQVAKLLGADVTAITRAENLDMVRSIGADRVIDYNREDFTTGSERYDVIFDMGANRSFAELRRVLSKDGRWLIVGGVISNGWLGPLGRVAGGIARSRFVSQKVQLVSARLTADDLATLANFLSAGKIRPVIETTFPLNDVGKALDHVEKGRVKGKVVVTMS